MEYFLYIIQIMLQYTPSFNKVCYTLRLQGCFLKIYKTKYYASAGGYVVQAVLLFSLCIDHGGYMSARLVSRLRKSQFPLPGVSKKNVPGKLNRNCSFPSGKLFAMWVLIVVLVIRQTGNIINWFLLVLRFVSLILL